MQYLGSYKYSYGTGKINRELVFYLDGDNIVAKFNVLFPLRDNIWKSTDVLFNEDIMECGRFYTLRPLEKGYTYEKSIPMNEMSKDDKLAVIDQLIKGSRRISLRTIIDNDFSYAYEKIINMDFYLV
jgi:hypothetical protein